MEPNRNDSPNNKNPNNQKRPKSNIWAALLITLVIGLVFSWVFDLVESSKYTAEQLHTYFDVERYPPIWHIHGEAARHNTMVLGHYYYGKLLAKMQQYISLLMSRYKARAAKRQSMELRSWLDYFILGDIYSLGFGFDPSEMDMWWLLCRSECTESWLAEG